MSDVYDIIIIGGGSAALSAAMTCHARGKRAAVIANSVETTSLYKAERIANYPGADNTTGRELAQLFRRQLDSCGADVIAGRALSVMPLGESFGVAVGNEFYTCGAVILAVGITRENLYPGEAEFLGRGVSYCATCDGMLYRGRTVAVVGADAEARADADFLESIGCKVLRFTDSLRYAIKGTDRVKTLVAGATEYEVDCVFIIKESIAVSALVPGLESGKAGIAVTRGGATNIPGVFAAGDCAGKPFQLAKAVGEGNTAALSACEYIDKEKGEIDHVSCTHQNSGI